jgi:hypothetical protein
MVDDPVTLGMFCVIGPRVNDTYGRTWKKTKEEAQRHATRIIQDASHTSKKVNRLFVVEVVGVVEVPQLQVVVRNVTREDMDEFVRKGHDEDEE